MLSSIIQSDLVQFVLKSWFVKIAIAVGLVLTVTFLWQGYQYVTSDDFAQQEAAGPSSITVEVGEMYFQQLGGDMPEGVIEGRVGDVIEFVNVGNLRHSVTIDSLDFDAVLNPGERTSLELQEEVADARLHCRFHQGHEAVITVREASADSSGFRHSHDTDQDHSGTAPGHRDSSGNLDALPVRSPEDAIERLDFELVDGVKEFRLSAEHIVWEYAEGYQLEAWAYNGQLPGPEIRVVEGDQVRVIFENNLPVATSVHWHGIDVPNEADGVPHVTQDAIEPGETFVYEFTAEPAGTRFYHSHGSHHGDEQQQVDMGLSGPFIIEPANYVTPDREYTMVLSERVDAGIYPINGRVYPNPEVFNVSEGERVRIRIIHAGTAEIHPMHMHGHQFEVVAIDGNEVPVANRQLRNTQPMMPGEIYDIEFVANNPGSWVFHCHHLGHAAGGMIAVINYE